MATTDTNSDRLFQYRVQMFGELGFEPADAVQLTEAKRLTSNIKKGQLYLYEVPIYWGDVETMLNNGATHDQVLRIFL